MTELALHAGDNPGPWWSLIFRFPDGLTENQRQELLRLALATWLSRLDAP